jgi:hypothetical protein
MTRKIPIVPCSGIGKSLGAAAREAAYVLTEDLRPDRTKVVALALLVLGDEEAKREVAGGEAKSLASCGASKVHKTAIFDVVRRHRGLKPEGVCDLNEDGLRLARATADEAAKIVDDIDAEGGHA